MVEYNTVKLFFRYLDLVVVLKLVKLRQTSWAEGTLSSSSLELHLDARGCDVSLAQPSPTEGFIDS